MSALSMYLDNVRNSVHRNLRLWALEDDYDKKKYLEKIKEYCDKLLNDPEEPKIKRKRMYYGKKYVTRR